MITFNNISSSGSFNFNVTTLGPTAPSSVDYLVVAGRAPGGDGIQNYSMRAGGGAGGLLQATGAAITPSVTYTITIGAGGAQSSWTNGSNSVISGSGFTTVTAVGGGKGADSRNYNVPAGNGGSGGGGATLIGSSTGKGIYPGSTYIDAARQGYDGGNNGTNGYPYPTAGGGGAGGDGLNGSGSSGGTGGPGLYSTISGSNVAYAGGGGGSVVQGSGYLSTGGIGGGGRGGSPGLAEAGTINTGGGGGAGGGTVSSPAAGGDGGSGIIIIRYADSYNAASNTTGSPNVTVAGGYRIYKFTSSGSITF